jgi:hypothetical protein
MALVSGARLGPYEVVSPLGKGAMGEVFRARDTRLGRDVAIKVLPEHTASSPEIIARFEREGRAVAALNHPNILALHDVGVAGGVSYAVMELLEGETLRERLMKDGRLPPLKALDLAVQFARGLAAAHARGIVHRDLKPENIFLTDDGRLKILDFGLAVQPTVLPVGSMDVTHVSDDKGVLVGTVGYMAPEQVRGEPATVRSDVFSFGLVVYELVTGRNPFRRSTAPETMAATLRDQPESLASIPGLPSVAARLVDRCVEKRPEDRPESMRDLAFALEAAGAERALDVGHSIRQHVPAGRLVTWMAVGACALLLLITWVMAVYVRASAERVASDAIAADLARAEGLVLRMQQQHLDRLQLTARLVGSFPELKALFETDAPTIRDFLQAYQQRNPGTPLLVALGPEGFVLARTDDAGTGPPERGQDWLAAVASENGAGVIAIDGRPYHAAISPAEAGGTLFGYVLAAAPIDTAFAQTLYDATEDEVVVLDSRGVAGSSLPGGRAPWESVDAFRAASGAGPLVIGTRRFSAREVPLATDPSIVAVLLTSRDDVTEPYRRIQRGLVVIGIGAAVLALVAVVVGGRRLLTGR